MSLRIEITQSQAILILDKVFDYTIVNAFFAFVRELPKEVETICINCEQVVHHDSSALGMLLFMHSELTHCRFAMENCNESLTRMLYLARLDQHFPLRQTADSHTVTGSSQSVEEEMAVA
jgi:anti-anti-sigma factor